MSNSEMTALIQQLKKSNRRWRRLALSLLTALGVALLLFTTSVAALQVRAERQARVAREAEQQALQQEELAKKRFEEAKGNVDAPQHKGRNP